ncbi:MAG: hypothetical protein Q8N88_05790 [Nanoarchaeota archaeon]|nr:hypothetical protein [Nanoarchaeota archaeon]
MKGITYKGLSEFIEGLRLFGLPKNQFPEVIAHEKAHLNRARELGYQAEYCIIITDPNRLTFRPSIHIYGDLKPSDNDMKKILSAPSNPSDWDATRLNSLERVAGTL